MLKTRLRAGAFVLLFALAAWAAIRQVFVPPLLGVADNGDFVRVTLPFGLRPIPSGTREYDYFERTYRIGPPEDPEHYILSEHLLVPPALAIHRFVGRFTRTRDFDIPSMGVVHTALFLAGIGLLLVCLATARTASPGRLVPVAAATVLAAIDATNVAYFNSFATEETTFLGFLFLATLLLWPCLRQALSMGVLVSIGTAGLFFVASKPQMAIAGPILGLAVLRLRILATSSRVRRAAAACAVLLAAAGLSSIWYSATHLRVMSNVNRYHAVFTGLLTVSTAPREDLADLGVDRALADHVGVEAYGDPKSPDFGPAWHEKFLNRVGIGTLAGFYLRHPGHAWRMAEQGMQRALTFPPFGAGNFELASGKPPRSHPDTFILWARTRSALFPSSALGLFAFSFVSILGAVWVRRRSRSLRGALMADYFLLMLALALSQFLLATYLSGMPDFARHVYPFRIALDACLLVGGTWALGAVAEVGTRLRRRIRARRAPTTFS